jgi:hypothetical protein
VDHRGAASICIVQGSTVTYHQVRDHLDDPRSARQINCEKTSSNDGIKEKPKWKETTMQNSLKWT